MKAFDELNNKFIVLLYNIEFLWLLVKKIKYPK